MAVLDAELAWCSDNDPPDGAVLAARDQRSLHAATAGDGQAGDDIAA
jgi:hypothetical protein